MAKPTLYFANTSSGLLPTTQTSNRWTVDAEFGTILTGDGNTVGLHLGALTNAQYSEDFSVIISHTAIEPVTNVKFYFGPTTNNRVGGTGFTHSADAAGGVLDYEEFLLWGDNSSAMITDSSAQDGIYLMYKNEPEVQVNQQLKTGYMDSLATARPLNADAKPNDLTAYPGDYIGPFTNFSGGDYAWLNLRLFVPNYIEDAGKRQLSFITRLTYSF